MVYILLTCMLVIAIGILYIALVHQNIPDEYFTQKTTMLRDEDLSLKTMAISNHKNMIGSIPIYYINLNRSPDRNKNMIEQFELYNIRKYQRIDAIDGAHIEPVHKNTYRVKGRDITFTNTFKKGSKSEVGCTLSHMLAIKTAYDNNERHVIITEDDISFGLLSLLHIPVDQLISDIPDDCDILMLSITDNRRNRYKPFPTKYNKKTNDIDSAASYLITRKGMQKVMKYYNNGYILDGTYKYVVSDYYLFTICNTYFLYPSIFYTINYKLKSTIHNEHTDIHIKNSLHIINQFQLLI